MSATRRQLIASCVGCLAIGGISGYVASVAQKSAPASIPKNIYALTVGLEGFLHRSSVNVYGNKASVFTNLHLNSGHIIQCTIPVRHAHTAEALPGTNRFIVVSKNFPDGVITNHKGEILHKLAIPNGYVFSGHALIHPSKPVILATMFHENAKNDGSIGVYDKSSYALLNRVPIGTIGPHQMTLMNDKQTIAIASRHLNKREHSGNRNYSLATLIDCDSLKVQKHITVGTNEREYFGHLAIGPDDMIFGVAERYLSVKPTHYENKAERNTKIAALREELSWDLDIFELDSSGEGIALPSGLIQINPESREIKRHLSQSGEKQRRPFSITYVPATGKVIAAYVASDTLTVFKNNTCKHYHSMQYRLRKPGGISTIPGTPYIVVNGKYFDTALIDTRDMSLVKHYQASNFGSVHNTLYIA